MIGWLVGLLDKVWFDGRLVNDLVLRLIQGGFGVSAPIWTIEFYGFQGVFRPQRLLSPPPCKEKNCKPPPLGQIPEHAPDLVG
jgi:hypothetical protein